MSAVSVLLLWIAVLAPPNPVHAAPAPPAQSPQPDRREPSDPETSPGQSKPVEPEPAFEINEFKVDGNTLLSADKLGDLLDDLTGSARTAADVEKARDSLEKFYHDAGYPTVLVNIPEQSAEGGVIRLQVVESRIGRVALTGNRYFASGQILKKLPALAPGAILFVPDVQLQIGKVNRNPDLKVVPGMVPGNAPVTVDVELKVEDQRPFHGSLEINNRNSNNTSELRLNGGLHYDNLWNREHALSFQYQLSPEDISEVKVFSGSYTLPAPWNADQSLVLYGVSSDSNSAFGEGFHTVGKGSIIGARAILPLPVLGEYTQSAVLGLDYKRFTELTGLADSSASDVNTPVQYLPFSFSYSGSLPDSGGLTLFNAGLNLSFRGAVALQDSFQNKRYLARGNYLSATMGLERRQQLPGGAGFLLKLDGQLADQPLISNEQFSAGGMESVRGYRESTLLGDNGFHAVTELSAPDLAPHLGLGGRFQVLPYLFYDCAALWVKDPLPAQDSAVNLQGTGIGVRGFLFRSLEYQLDWAIALSDTSSIRTGDTLVHFRVKYQF